MSIFSFRPPMVRGANYLDGGWTKGTHDEKRKSDKLIKLFCVHEGEPSSVARTFTGFFTVCTIKWNYDGFSMLYVHYKVATCGDYRSIWAVWFMYHRTFAATSHGSNCRKHEMCSFYNMSRDFHTSSYSIFKLVRDVAAPYHHCLQGDIFPS